MLLQRRRAAKSLIDYARYVDIPGVPLQDDSDDQLSREQDLKLAEKVDEVGDTDYRIVETPLAQHHILVLQACQDMVEGKLHYYVTDDGEVYPFTGCEGDSFYVCRRVMLMLPPGSAKSTYGSVVFPTWYMGNNAGSEIILTGYGDSITKKHGKRARQICASNSYRAVFGFNVNPETRAADNWEASNKSSYKSAGILSGITGFRTDLLVWDDITKGRKEADSVTIREDTWNAYIDDARSRKKPNASELGIGTRWHEDETMGRILPEGYAGESGYMQCRDGNVWYVLCMPAECERDDDPLGRQKGDMIWTEWFNDEYWTDKRVNPRSWASLYQQRPSLEEGLYFKREWFKTYRTLPKDVDYYIAFDPAVTEAEDADDTAIQVWAVDTVGKIYLVDEWVRKCTMDIWIDQLMTWIAIYKPIECISETGVIRRASEPYIKRAMTKTGHYAMFEYVGRNADKSAMARPAQAMTAAGMVYYPENSVGDNTIDELLRFPAAKADHRVDAKANFFLRLEVIWDANPPKVKKSEEGVLTHGFKVSSIMPPIHSKKKSRWSK